MCRVNELQGNYDLLKKQIAEHEAASFAYTSDFWTRIMCLHGTYRMGNSETAEFSKEMSVRLVFSLWYPALSHVCIDSKAKCDLDNILENHLLLPNLRLDSESYANILNILSHKGVIAEFSTHTAFGGIINNVVVTRQGKEMYLKLNT